MFLLTWENVTQTSYLGRFIQPISSQILQYNIGRRRTLAGSFNPLVTRSYSTILADVVPWPGPWSRCETCCLRCCETGPPYSCNWQSTYLGRVHGAGVEHAACDAARQGLGTHVVLLGVVHHREPDTKQQRQQLLVGRAARHDVAETSRETLYNVGVWQWQHSKDVLVYSNIQSELTVLMSFSEQFFLICVFYYIILTCWNLKENMVRILAIGCFLI